MDNYLHSVSFIVSAFVHIHPFLKYESPLAFQLVAGLHFAAISPPTAVITDNNATQLQDSLSKFTLLPPSYCCSEGLHSVM